jgi:hypothetical protein
VLTIKLPNAFIINIFLFKLDDFEYDVLMFDILIIVLIITLIGFFLFFVLLTGGKEPGRRPPHGRPPRRPPRIVRPPRPPRPYIVGEGNEDIQVPTQEQIDNWVNTDQSIMLRGTGRIRDILYIKLAIQNILFVVRTGGYAHRSIYSLYWPRFAVLNNYEKARLTHIAANAQFTGELEANGYTLYGGVIRKIDNTAATPSLNLISLLSRNDNTRV